MALAPDFGPVQAAIDTFNLAYTTSQLPALSKAVQTLGHELAAKDERTEEARSILAMTNKAMAAQAFAHAIAETLPGEPATSYVAAIIELLKWPTTAGPATDELLEVLHERVPGAPGKEARLAATIQWVATTFPEIDLDSPPTPPASGSTGAAW